MNRRSHPTSSTTISGGLPIDKSEKYTQDLNKLDKIHLMEIKQREEKLLANIKQLVRLPDKGQKIKTFYQKVLNEISKRDEIESAAELFSNLNLVSSGVVKLNHLEWTGNMQTNSIDVIDSDDDEDNIDPIKILAQNPNSVKIIKVLPPDESLITESDIKEIKSFKCDPKIVSSKIANSSAKDNEIITKLNNSLSECSISSDSSNTISGLIDPYCMHLCEKSVDKLPEIEKFKPYKTTKSNVHDPEKEQNSKIHIRKNWEITAATPPPIKNPGTKLISLQDSIDIQVDYLNKLKNLQESQVAERLARLEKLKITIPDEESRKANQFFNSYREIEIFNDDEPAANDSDEGFRDDENEKDSSVTFTVYE